MVTYPSAWVNLYLLLDDFGQPDAERLIQLSGAPLSFRVERNSFQDADTAEVIVDLKDFPFDPRILRGATVEVFLGFPDRVDPDFWVERTPDEMRELALFAGVLDESESKFDEDHRTFKLRCRDYTAYFLDAELEPGEKSYGDLTLTQVIENLIGDRPETAAITVDDRDGIGAQIVLARTKRREGKGTGTRKSRNGESAWDFVQESALEAGAIVYVELDTVVIRSPETLFVGSGETEPITYVLGHDVVSLRNARRLGRQHGIGVQVTSFDVDGKRTLQAEKFDPEPARVIAAAPVGQSDRKVEEKQKTARTFTVRGITDPSQLQRIADQLHTLLRHHELEAEFVVENPTDSNGRAVQTYRFGDPVQLRVSDDVQDFGFRTLDEQVRALIARGYPDQDAKKIALALDELRLPFYLHRASYRFDHDQGFELSLEVRGRKQVEVG